MAHATRLPLDSASPDTGAGLTPSPGDDAHLRNALRHCAPSTYEAARQFRLNARPGDLYMLVHGVIERYVEPGLRHRMRDAHGDLRLAEDLGLDSLTRMQVVFRLEEVLLISIHDEELRQFHTLGEVRQLIERIVGAERNQRSNAVVQPDG